MSGLRWPGGLRERITLVLLAALLLQFAGGELAFQQMESRRIAAERSERLAERLAVAERLLLRLPADERAQTAAELWLAPLTIRWQAATPDEPADRRVGATLQGARQMGDDTWLTFHDAGHFAEVSLWPHYLTSVVLLILCGLLAAVLLARMIGRPLHALARAADAVGRNEPVPIAPQGPREVQQVAIAFGAMQARLLELVRERTHSLAAVSHDLRTPLARMRLHAATIDDEETRLLIEQDVQEMEAFVTSVLDYLRGDDPEPAQLVDLASMLLTIVDDARDLGGDAQYTGPARLEAQVAPLKLRRVVTNLVQNAIRHGGSADVTLEQEAQCLVICVRDHGPGIPEHQLESVFAPFFRLESSRNRNAGGAGLGLSIARRLTESLGGTLTLHNQGGGGLCAKTSLPVQRVLLAPPASSQPPGAPKV